MNTVFHLCFMHMLTSRRMVRSKIVPGSNLELGYAPSPQGGVWAARVPVKDDKAAAWRMPLTAAEVGYLLAEFRLELRSDLIEAVLKGMPPSDLQARSVEIHGADAPDVRCVRDGNVKAAHVGRTGVATRLQQKRQAEVVRDGQEVFRLYYAKEQACYVRTKRMHGATVALRCYRAGDLFTWTSCPVTDDKLGVCSDALSPEFRGVLMETFGIGESSPDSMRVGTMSPRALWRAARKSGTATQVVCDLTGKFPLAVGGDGAVAAVPGEVVPFVLRRAVGA